ncbi:hypothetical protein HDE_06951 [Halotydeus destructor]|nr:hypothetical protein HDE_06951 [Halotydeus destructor]
MTTRRPLISVIKEIIEKRKDRQRVIVKTLDEMVEIPITMAIKSVVLQDMLNMNLNSSNAEPVDLRPLAIEGDPLKHIMFIIKNYGEIVPAIKRHLNQISRTQLIDLLNCAHRLQFVHIYELAVSCAVEKINHMANTSPDQLTYHMTGWQPFAGSQ